ncbi:uncharacterized protein LOC121730523 [Aricia agestis]|uniref:uncharacterized protein LOC121730523 n=1 Tax=Aricia agestis TaxID=91739 RepID=UPI001C20347A|nr:uncharacterized protein LOC121730523 [Aricia agestis]
MRRALCCVMLLLTHICFGEARITAEVCQTKPRERHCVIESMSLSRWPHTNRYTFDWRTQRCYIMHWSSYCPLPTHESNNFASEAACVAACAGWA